jgi:hypothetical protein
LLALASRDLSARHGGKTAELEAAQIWWSVRAGRRQPGLRRGAEPAAWTRLRTETWDPAASMRYDQQLWNELVSLRLPTAPTVP